DQAAEILVVEELRHDIGVDARYRRTAVEREVARNVAFADLAGERVEGPYLAGVLELPADAIRRRPRKRHGNNRVELRQIATLQRERSGDVVDVVRDHSPVETDARVTRARAGVDPIRPVAFLEREHGSRVSFDCEGIVAHAAGARGTHGSRHAVGRGGRRDVEEYVGGR